MTAKQFLRNYGWDKKSIETKMDMPTMIALMEKYVKERFPPGTYISKSVWAKVTEENKSLKKDIYDMVAPVKSGKDLIKSQQVRMKWRKKFQRQQQFINMLTDIAKS